MVERWFFTAMAGAMLAVAIAGFAPSILNSSGRRAPLSLLAAAHGVVFSIWLAVFFIQARLIAHRHIALHYRVGVAAAFVAALMIPLSYATCIAMVRRGFDLSGDLRIEHDPSYEVVFPLGDVILFTVLIAAGIACRRRPHIHRTLILFANIALMPAPLAHLIGHVPWLAAMPGAIILVPIMLFLGAAIGRDFLLLGRVRPLTAGIAAAMFISGPLRAGLIGPSATWHKIVHWLAS